MYESVQPPPRSAETLLTWASSVFSFIWHRSVHETRIPLPAMQSYGIACAVPASRDALLFSLLEALHELHSPFKTQLRQALPRKPPQNALALCQRKRQTLPDPSPLPSFSTARGSFAEPTQLRNGYGPNVYGPPVPANSCGQALISHMMVFGDGGLWEIIRSGG